MLSRRDFLIATAVSTTSPLMSSFAPGQQRQKQEVYSEKMRVESAELDSNISEERTVQIVETLLASAPHLKEIFINNRSGIELTLSRSRFVDSLLRDIQKNGDSPSTVTVVPHVICKGSDFSEFSNNISRVKSLGFSAALIIRGDSTGGDPNSLWDNPPGYGSTVAEYLRQISGLGTKFYGATHPELHARSISILDEVSTIKEKSTFGVSEFITQVSLDSRALAGGLAVIAKHAVVRPGIFPIDLDSQAVRVSSITGCKISLHQEEFIRGRYSEESQKVFWMENTIGVLEEIRKLKIFDVHIYASSGRETLRKTLDLF